MNGENVSAKVNADVSLSATKSQALPLSMMGLSAICLLAGLGFWWMHPDRCWLPLGLSLMFAAGGSLLWWRSHSSSEFDGNSPTEIVDGRRGVRVLTDSRSLESPKAIQHLAQLLTQIAHRAPLPEPDGMVDERGRPEPHRKSEAEQAVERANAQAEAVVRNAAQLLIRKDEPRSAPTIGAQRLDPAAARWNLPLQSRPSDGK